MYLKVNTKFQLALTVATLWGIFSIWAAQFWFADLSAIIGWFLAGFLILFIAVLILFIAVVPGFINALMVFSLLMDKRPLRKSLDSYPPITKSIVFRSKLGYGQSATFNGSDYKFRYFNTSLMFRF